MIKLLVDLFLFALGIKWAIQDLLNGDLFWFGFLLGTSIVYLAWAIEAALML